jgi:membrane protein
MRATKNAKDTRCCPYNRPMQIERTCRHLVRSCTRIFPDCLVLCQAIAFNMFLAFFPLLLFSLGFLAITSHFVDALREIPDRLSLILPPGSMTVIAAYFVRRVARPWRWMLGGLIGTLLAGTQVMSGYMEGFRIIEGDLLNPSYFRRQLRALSLLCITIFPMLLVVGLTVYGKQTRDWLMLETGSVPVTRVVELVFYAAAVFFFAMTSLILLYHIGRPGHPGWRSLLPGATVSTILWWSVDISFSFYMRKMPYDFVYRGLAAAIGLLLWMFLTAIVVFMGAAYNAEVRETMEAEQQLASAHAARTTSSLVTSVSEESR